MIITVHGNLNYFLSNHQSKNYQLPESLRFHLAPQVNALRIKSLFGGYSIVKFYCQKLTCIDSNKIITYLSVCWGFQILQVIGDRRKHCLKLRLPHDVNLWRNLFRCPVLYYLITLVASEAVTKDVLQKMVLSCQICEIFKNTYFEERLQKAPTILHKVTYLKSCSYNILVFLSCFV